MIIYAGIVVFNPSNENLFETISTLSTQCTKVLLFINSPLDLCEFSNDKIQIIHEGSNLGIALAHSRFIEFSKEKGADFLILSDQDSVYPNNYVKSMLNMDSCTLACPSWINLLDNSNEIKKQFVLNYTSICLNFPKHNDFLAHAISSGMFININNLDFKCLPDTKLFIDWVDNDWCWRLVSDGHKIRYNKDIVLKHRLGDNDTTLFGINFTKRSPTRDYYIIRNAFYLLKHRNYKIQVNNYLRKKIFQHILLSILTDFKHSSLRIPLIIMAIKHGIRGTLGPLKLI